MHDWLIDDKRGEWVLILDNVDDASFLVETQRAGQTSGINSSSGDLEPLVSYIPQCSNGSVLITTRSKDEAMKLVEPRNIITIEPMSKVEALRLLKNKLGNDEDHDDTAELANVLEYMPLAIVQAAANISQRVPRYSVRSYLEDWKSEHKRTDLLSYEGGQLRRDREAKSSIFHTWQLSFNHIRKVRPSAADLLSLMSFFDRQGVPEALLRNRSTQQSLPQHQSKSKMNKRSRNWVKKLGISLLHGSFQSNPSRNDSHKHKNENKNATTSTMSDDFEKDIITLRNYSFISVNKKGTAFGMHRLVQLATREWLKAHGQRERWNNIFIRNLDEKFPLGKFENWTLCQGLFPHVQSAVAQRPKEEKSLLHWASILHNAAWYMYEMGNGMEAEKMAVQAVKIRKGILGRENDDTLHSISSLASAYYIQGRHDKAEKLELQVLEINKKRLGLDHIDTLISMDNLALTYSNQRRWNEAEKLQLQVLEISKKILGLDHEDTLMGMRNLASTYYEQGRLDEAVELEVQVLETLKKKLGVDHPDTLASMNNLAITWWELGRETEAIILMEECVQLRKRVLGPDHPYTLGSIKRLARWKAEQELANSAESNNQGSNSN